MPGSGFSSLNKKIWSFAKIRRVNCAWPVESTIGGETLDTALYTKLLTGRRARDYTRILTIADLTDTEEVQPLTSEYGKPV
jgi:hypothetical protein